MSDQTIFVKLLNEGTTVFRPVAAERLTDGLFRIVGERPNDEEWAFGPGQKVAVKQHIFSDGTSGLIADREAINPDLKFKDWEDVERQVEKSVTNSLVPFDAGTISNARDFLRVTRRLCPIPEGVAKGYWSTVRIWWKDIEVEIFEDRYELYLFNSGQTDIQYFNHAPTTEVPSELIQHLPRIAE